MREQIEANRRLIGPGGGLQITGGDVVEAYWREGRADELVDVVRHANAVGLVPMVMTHGQTLLEHPALLERLVRKGGLRKLALHIDTTQAGRPGYPLRRLSGEADLHELRASFVDLILDVRRCTRTSLCAAHTVTVTERNIGSIAEIPRWLLADRRRLKAFRMVSFQTEADVGRTRRSAEPVTPEAAWSEICRGVGADLPRDNLQFGHPDCSNMTSLLVVYPERRVINLISTDPTSRNLWARLLREAGGVGGRGESTAEWLLHRVSLLARNPSLALELLRYAGSRLHREGFDLIPRALTGRIGVLNVVLHNFMGRSELAQPHDERVSQRLSACAFRGAARREGKWVAVPMCEMNTGDREAHYAHRIRMTGR